jgi:hypothetical protein
MYAAMDIARELDEGLKQLFDAGLQLCLEIQADARASGREEKARLGLTFHRISRGVRQTAALRMRLVREAERSQREASAEAVERDNARLARRKAHVKAAVESLIWTEADSEETLEELNAKFEELLDIETQDAETFEAEPLDEQIARLAWLVGLQVPPPQGEVSPKATEGVSAAGSQPDPLRASPLGPSGTAPPEREQLGGPDHPWRSSG